MNTGYLIRYDELALKGKNRIEFEKQLIWNIERKLHHFHPKIERLWGRIWVKLDESDKEDIEKELSKVFGISSFSPVVRCASTVEEICGRSVELMRDGVTFRVSTNRVDKKFPINSQEMNRKVAGVVFQEFPNLKVDLDNPKLDLGIEIRDDQTFLYVEKIQGLSGLPVGTSGRVLTLLSGGIDSPVAAWLMMKRGCDVDFIHFYSYPYVGIQSKEKVIDLAKRITQFQNSGRLFVVPFQKIQEAIHEKCHERFRTLLYRRAMQRISTEVATAHGMQALVTGESLGQVASQTLENIATVSRSTDILILRPLIASNKSETIALAKKIGTYDISIRPFDDCCTVFQPQSPATKSSLKALLLEEELLSLEPLIQETIKGVEIISF